MPLGGPYAHNPQPLQLTHSRTPLGPATADALFARRHRPCVLVVGGQPLIPFLMFLSPLCAGDVNYIIYHLMNVLGIR